MATTTTTIFEKLGGIADEMNARANAIDRIPPWDFLKSVEIFRAFDNGDETEKPTDASHVCVEIRTYSDAGSAASSDARFALREYLNEQVEALGLYLIKTGDGDSNDDRIDCFEVAI